MSLRYALLALLVVEPMTGYDLSKQFQSSVAHVWHAPNSQIYPELRRMEKDDLITGAEITWGQLGKKTEYRITDAGRDAFRTWMNSDLQYSRERDPAHLRAAYLEWATPDAARAQMLTHLDVYRSRRAEWAEKIDEINNGTSAMLSKRLAHSPAEEHHRIKAFKRYTYEGMIARADQEISWAERGLALIDELSDET